MNRILIVDDNPLNLKLAQLMVISEGFEADTAADAMEALERVAVRPPDVILMDLQMPGIDGLELTRRLKAEDRTRDIPVIALTAAAMSRDRQEARDAGCEGFISKPLDTRKFGADLAPFLRRAEERRAAA
jgi:CheY-like chemotaxis protein